MPWCPNCKTEYQEGYTVCNDCKVELVAELGKEFTPFVQSDSLPVADKLVRYFEYSGVASKLEFNEETDMYQIFIPVDKEKEARKLYQAFIFVERENLAKGNVDGEASKTEEPSKTAPMDTPEMDRNPSSDTVEDPAASSEEPEDQALAEETNEEDTIEGDASEGAATNLEEASEEDGDEDLNTSKDIYQGDAESSSVYVMKADQYKDLAGTVWVFLGLGILGLVFVALNVIGIISFLSGWMPNLVMGALFVIFIYIGISTNKKAKKVQSEIEEENRLTKEINQWLEQNITEVFLDTIKDSAISPELNYLKTTATIKEMLVMEFGPQNMSYLDRLVEEYYTRSFDE